MLPRLWLLLVFTVFGLAASPALAASPRAVAVEGHDADFSARFASALGDLLPDRVKLVPPAQADLRITLDAQSFRDALKSGSQVIGVNVPRTLALASRSAGCRCTALFAGPDPGRQLRLIRELLPTARTVSVLLSDSTGWARSYLQKTHVSPPLKLDFRTVKSTDQLGPALARVLPHSDAMLALYDPKLFNAATAKLVLLTSYRQGRPVVGPDEAFVRAGSLATTYSSGYDLVASVARMLKHMDGKKLPPPAYPEQFSVTLNEHVARAYDLPVRDPQWLVSRLREAKP